MTPSGIASFRDSLGPVRQFGTIPRGRAGGIGLTWQNLGGERFDIGRLLGRQVIPDNGQRAGRDLVGAGERVPDFVGVSSEPDRSERGSRECEERAAILKHPNSAAGVASCYGREGEAATRAAR